MREDNAVWRIIGAVGGGVLAFGIMAMIGIPIPPTEIHLPIVLGAAALGAAWSR